VSSSDLEMPEPGEPREILALQHNIAQLHREEVALRRELEAANLRQAAGVNAESEHSPGWLRRRKTRGSS